MHWVEVSGHQLPRPCSEQPALELCNTWAGWGAAPRRTREYLLDYDRLAVWAGYVGLVDQDTVAWLRREAEAEPTEAARALEKTRRFRTALYQVLTGAPDSEAFGLVAATAQRASARSELVDDAGTARWRLPDSVRLELPLLAVAHAAAELLTSTDRAKVRACPGHDCGWLFVDRRGRRRWCSMDSCGNRAKVKAYADRHRD
jgi:predicted RNA-binding Zn ribbon-like protein